MLSRMNPLVYIWRHPLSRRNRAEAFRRFFRWQLGTRILKQPVLMPFVDEVRFLAEPGMRGVTGNIYCGLHEFVDMAFLLHFLRKNDLFLDIGANVGSYSLLAAGVVGARTVAIEPVPSTFAKLRRNLVVNELWGSVAAHCTAVGSRSGVLKFTRDRGTANQVVPDDYDGQIIEVPVRTVDSIVRGSKVQLMKVDTEGYEQEVFSGATETLGSEHTAALIIEGDGEEITRLVETAGFRRASYDPFSRTLFPGEGQRQQFGNNNHLWVRNLRQVAERCAAAPAVEALGVKV